jgi:hypothetical protein
MLVPTGVTAGSPSTTYRAERRKLHAVASTHGVLARETVCGVDIPGTPFGDFCETLVHMRCPKCAEALGVEHGGQ